MYACIELKRHTTPARKVLNFTNTHPAFFDSAARTDVAPTLSWMPPTSPTTHLCPTPIYAAAKSPAEPSTTARPTGCAAVESAASASATATASPE